MKYLNYVRDPDGVFDIMQEQEDGSVLAKDTFNVVIPRRYLERNMAYIGDTVRTIGIMMLACNGKWSLFSVCTFVELLPDSISYFNYMGVDYMEMTFDKGSPIFKSTESVQAGINVYYIYKELISNGNVPFFMETTDKRDDLAACLDTAYEYAGTKIGSQRPITELIASLSARNPEELTQYFRQMTPEQQAKVRPNFIGLTSAAYSATNTLQRLAGAHAADQGMLAAIIYPTERITKQERLIRST